MEYSSNLHKLNRMLSRNQVLEQLLRKSPVLFQQASIVGEWVWIENHELHPSKLLVEIVVFLRNIGFHYNEDRFAWQHPCGHPCKKLIGRDPREYYGVQPAYARG